MVIRELSASASFEGTFTFETPASTTIEPCATLVDWSQLLSYGYFESLADYKNFVNELHLEEYRKDLFREASITPRETPYSQRVTNYCIPAKRNYKGRQYQRL